ncbi:serine O-acetyltransferase EpsC [Mangrovimonas spongiae]|uniref:Serine acetyltransferase n=1 Tax=Mangrovimonas spongiae TaxID=2494697 RepID=A0A3R9ME46_9FLAO|nr:serine O-acetyltransferase EpsC [Mangrovimonas spongiae]RSK39907.1 serine acetyltransferase [Mangrovimonas spongiae]
MQINLRIKETVPDFTKRLFYMLFDNEQKQQQELKALETVFKTVVSEITDKEPKKIWEDFKNKLPEIKHKIQLDALATEKNDPACKSLEEIYLAYPGFHAIATHRMSHELFKLGVPIVARMMSECIHGKTGIDIHPGATIGESFFIDHGTGIVIGETSIIKNNVKIFQGVTLGGLSVKKSLAQTKRHPTIENNVTIYANATILGGDIVIGENSIIGANVWITQSVPPNSLVTYKSEIKISTRNHDK